MKNYYVYFLALTVALFSFSSCKKDIQEIDFEYFNDFSGSKWVIIQYDNTLTNLSTFPQDTIHFIDNDNYQINDGPIREYYYRIYKPDNNEFQSQSFPPELMLFNCTTFGGDYYAAIDRENINDNELNNILFRRSAEHSVIVWLERIE